METKLSIVGTYLKDKSGFFNDRSLFKLVKCKRLPTNGKTPEFLILKPCCGQKLLPDGTKERYISGIFWQSDSTFNIDFEGIRYIVNVTTDGLNVALAGKGKGL
jgi:hypothetical protein